MGSIELRKEEEQKFHNFVRELIVNDYEEAVKHYASNEKWYSITRDSKKFTNRWLSEHCKSKIVLDYCCGNGHMTPTIVKAGAKEVIGIDISDFSIENAKKNAAKEECSGNTKFMVMDAENMAFKDRYFDTIFVSGVLHHLDLEKAYRELARVLNSDGSIVCIEALAHNKIIGFYRKRTPQLRTKWEAEHILYKKDIEFAKKYFDGVKILGFFHLTSILTAPLRKTKLFPALLHIFEFFDRILLRLPLLKWQAWQVIFELSLPKNE